MTLLILVFVNSLICGFLVVFIVMAVRNKQESEEEGESAAVNNVTGITNIFQNT